MKSISPFIAVVALITIAASSSFAKTHTKVVHGKPLFKYPNPQPVYIITVTQDDVERMRQERLLKELSRATYVKRARHKTIPELN